MESLSAAILTLLEHKQLEEISIQNITDEAGIGYATFFRRFSGKEDLLNYIAAEEIRRVLNLSQDALTQLAEPDGEPPLLDYVQKHKKLWKTLLNGGAAPTMREEFMRAAAEIAVSRERQNPWIPIDLAVPFVTSGIFEFLAWWVRQPESLPKDKVILLLNALIIDVVVTPRDISPFED